MSVDDCAGVESMKQVYNRVTLTRLDGSSTEFTINELADNIDSNIIYDITIRYDGSRSPDLYGGVFGDSIRGVIDKAEGTDRVEIEERERIE